PVAQIIKEHYPDAKVYYLISPTTAPLFDGHHFVDGVITYPKLPFLKTLQYFINEFRRLEIDHYLYVGGKHLPSLAARLAHIPFVGGHHNSLKGQLLLKHKHRLHQHRSRVEMHESLYNIKLLDLLGIKTGEIIEHLHEKIFWPLSLKHQEILASIDKAKALVQNCNHHRPATTALNTVEFLNHHFQWNDNYIIIHPGMKGHTLNWPSHFYLRLIDFLDEKLSESNSAIHYIFSYTQNDQKYIEAIVAHIDPHYTPLLGKVFFLDGEKIGLRSYLGVISKAKLFIGPSTGTSHLANALGIDLVAIYSPIQVQSPRRWGPFFKKLPKGQRARHKVIVPTIKCPVRFHCIHNKCENYPCMEKIRVETVGLEVLKMLHSEPTLAPTATATTTAIAAPKDAPLL
ncbi:MAG: glycosyltransferase family 9 protein, partial [Oligoflexia bacterium]|nr:glycosyltransferase family 9 protein [Oligoflexia bacterium]